MDVRVGLWRKLSTEELMLLNCGVREDSWESIGLQEDPTATAAKSLQSCPTLCDPIGSPPGSPVPGSLQARTPEWVAISFSRGSSQPRDWTWVSHVVGGCFTVWATREALLMNIQDWLPLGWTGWISLQSKGLSRGFSNTTVQKHQFFGAQLSS